MLTWRLFRLLALEAIGLASFASAQSSYPSNYQNASVTTSAPSGPITSCPIDCTRDPIWSWKSTWQPMNINTTITHATVITFIDAANQTSVSTRFETDLGGYKIPNTTNAAGTVTTTFKNYDSAKGSSITYTIAYPTQIIDYDNSFQWYGVLPTTKSGLVQCLTVSVSTDTGTKQSYETFPSHPLVPQPTQSLDSNDTRGWHYILEDSTLDIYSAIQDELFPGFGPLSCAEGPQLRPAPAYAYPTAAFVTMSTTSRIDGTLSGAAKKAPITSSTALSPATTPETPTIAPSTALSPVPEPVAPTALSPAPTPKTPTIASSTALSPVPTPVVFRPENSPTALSPTPTAVVPTLATPATDGKKPPSAGDTESPGAPKMTAVSPEPSVVVPTVRPPPQGTNGLPPSQPGNPGQGNAGPGNNGRPPTQPGNVDQGSPGSGSNVGAGVPAPAPPPGNGVASFIASAFGIQAPSVGAPAAPPAPGSGGSGGPAQQGPAAQANQAGSPNVGNAANSPQVLSVGGSAYTAIQQNPQAAPVFTLGGQTASAGGPAIIVSGSTISIATSGAVVNGVSQTLRPATAGTNAQANPVMNAPLIIGSTPVTANAAGAYVIGGQTLTPGAVATVSGTRVSIASNGASALVGSSVQILQSSAPNVPLTIGTAGSGTWIVGSQTLTSGAISTVSGTTISLASDGASAFIGSSVQALASSGQVPQSTGPSAPSASAKPTAPIRIGTAQVTPTQGAYIIGGQKITPGAVATVSGTVISLASNGASAIIGSSTQILYSSAGVPSSAQPTAPLTIGTAQIAPTQGVYVVGGTTLTPGAVATVQGTTVSVDGSSLVLSASATGSASATAMSGTSRSSGSSVSLSAPSSQRTAASSGARLRIGWDVAILGVAVMGGASLAWG